MVFLGRYVVEVRTTPVPRSRRRCVCVTERGEEGSVGSRVRPKAVPCGIGLQFGCEVKKVLYPAKREWWVVFKSRSETDSVEDRTRVGTLVINTSPLL